MEPTLQQKLEGLRQIAQEKLQAILCSIPDNRKELIIEPDLIRPLEHVCGASWLKSKGVAKICKFDVSTIPLKTCTIVYAIPSDITVFGHVLNQIQAIVSVQPNHMNPDFGAAVKPFHIIVLPNVFHSHSIILEEEGLHGLVQLHRFNWDFLWLDTNVMSLETPSLFRDVYIDKDYSLLGCVAQSLRIFDMVFKKPNLILAHGPNSAKVMAMLDRLENGRSNPSTSPNSDFGAMLIMDRNMDFPTCLLTPVVYSGMLLDIFHAKAGTLTIDVDNNRLKADQLNFLKVIPKTNKDSSTNSVSHHRLYSSQDAIFRENRFKHFSEVVGLLSAQAKLIGMERSTLKDMKLKDMQQYVAERLPKLTSQKKELFKHLIMCETIVNDLGSKFENIQSLEEAMLVNDSKKQTFARIQEQLAIDAHRVNALRQVCLMHLTCGISQEEAVSFMQNYLNAFGHRYLSVFVRLATAKLFPEIDQTPKITQKLSSLSILKQTPFQSDSAKLKLIPEAQNSSSGKSSKEPTCPSYVFNGTYIPLVAQLLNYLLKAEHFEEFASKVGHIDQLKVWKYLCRGDCRVGDVTAAIRTSSLADVLPLKRKSVMVFIVGGVTYAEIAACNLVGKLTGTTIVMASDCVAASGDFIKAAFQK